LDQKILKTQQAKAEQIRDTLRLNLGCQVRPSRRAVIRWPQWLQSELDDFGVLV